jgi:hypothetical protein
MNVKGFLELPYLRQKVSDELSSSMKRRLKKFMDLGIKLCRDLNVFIPSV